MAGRGSGTLSISPATLAAVADSMGEEYAAIPLCVRYSGMVWEQLVALTRRSCDPAGSSVEVYNVAVETASGVVFKPLRRGYTAQCSIDSPAAPALARRLASLKGGRSALVFTDADGQPLRRRWFDAQIWRPALEAIGAEATLSLENLAVDRLRASWAEKAATKRRYHQLGEAGGRSA